MHGGLQLAKNQKLKAKKKLRGVRLEVVSRTDTIHDRRSSDLLINAHVAPIEVEDPYDKLGRIIVFRSLRDDPLAGMHQAKQIDQAQFTAGRHWQKAYELAEVGGARAIDPTKEAVDGGGIPQATISDAQIKAFADLTKAARALGLEGESIVRDVLGAHRTIAQTAAKRGFSSEREKAYIGTRFRECLETLACTFGYAMPKKSTTSRI